MELELGEHLFDPIGNDPLFQTLQSIQRESSIAIILGSAFDSRRLSDLQLEPRIIETAYGGVELYQVQDVQRHAYVLFRHGIPHRYLLDQIPIGLMLERSTTSIARPFS